MYLWVVVMILLGVLRLASAVIQWTGRIHYERARAAAVTAMAHAVAAGGVIWDERADGTVLRVMVPSPSTVPPGSRPPV
jgi:hypothetical protein